ncbi:alpha-1A adrenergic receptor [Bradysia coprophila]|uniref:alpha-1A adrenergic receptor n=1 Tax=Bradysia coprophila TaxID=38358 RepID=UPI00187D9F42|nr:alpha-1A adrenergic receptor [Bradysia coprophila]
MDKMSHQQLESAVREVPDHLMTMIMHYVTGFHNISAEEISEPIVKQSLRQFYIVFIIQYAILVVGGVVANVYVIYYIIRYKLYTDVTHAFMMNLSICHCIESMFVLPMTLMVIIIQNWIYGQFMCFFLPLLQDIPLHVVLITHLLIAWDRMRWLGDPLKSRLPSFVCSCATWLTGMVISLPYPIYTTYLDLGTYIPKFRGVGICVVNLVDDMQEYMRGLFVMMYCAPATVLAYLYIRTSRELRPPEGPLGVMMFEHRADVRNRQRTSSTSTPSATRTAARSNNSRSYDLYDAEVDVNREKRTQNHLGAMAAVQVICMCPLMILRIARMVLEETYENTSHFDITFLMFVWMGFLPTVINPCIYGSWMLSRTAKERLRGYFRLSSRRVTKLQNNECSTENSVTQEITNETCDEPKAMLTEVVAVNNQNMSKINVISDHRTLVKPKKADGLSTSSKGRIVLAAAVDKELVNNSCSNITSSTYCNDHSYYDKSPLFDRDSLYSVSDRKSLSRPSLQRSQDNILSESDIMSRRESSSTYERDMEIIDLLERERSMDIQDMIEQERKGEKIRSITRHNSSFERHHRKLPDISKLAPISPKKLDHSVNFPNLVFTHQSDFGDVNGVSARVSNSRKSSQGSYSNRDSITGRQDIPGDHMGVGNVGRNSRTRSNHSSTRSSIKSRDRRISAEYYNP